MDEKFKNLIMFGVYGTNKDIEETGCFIFVLFIIIGIIYGVYKLFN